MNKKIIGYTVELNSIKRKNRPRDGDSELLWRIMNGLHLLMLRKHKNRKKGKLKRKVLSRLRRGR